MSEVDHHADGRDVTNSLIELSEMEKYLFESNSMNAACNNDWSDVVVGWKSGISSLKFSHLGTSVKKKKVVERTVFDLHHGGIYGNQGDDYWSNTSTEPKVNVKCIDDDFEALPMPPWKSSIEQGTFRYIPDNGSYRTLKFMFDDRKDWYTIRKKYPEKVSAAWHHTCKRLQRQVKRQLKKDIKNAEKERGTNPDSNSSHNSSKNSVEPHSGDDLYSSKSDTHIKAKCDFEKISLKETNKYASCNKETTKDSNSDTLDPFSRPLYRNDIRVKSTHSDSSLNHVKKMKTIPESEPITPVPQYSIPSGSHMCKSASDLYIANFSSRMNALECEIKKDTKLLRRNENDLTKLQNNRGKFKETQRSNFIENSTSTLTPRVVKTEPLTSDIFSVKPMTQKDLKPLEKTRSYKKPAGVSNQTSDCINHDAINYASSNSMHTTQNSHITNGSEFENTSNDYQSLVNNSKQLLLSTLIGTKINALGNKKTSKRFSSPSNITIFDNNTSANVVLAEHHSGTIKQLHVIEKNNEKNTSLKAVPALLPEISGKRLEMTSISHRLL